MILELRNCGFTGRRFRARRGSWICLLVLACLLGAASLDAQDDGGTLQVRARLVVLDVTVTDAKGKPMEGLTRDDFAVFEDNKLQTIRSFETPAMHALPEKAEDLEQARDEVFDPAKPASFGASPVTILVLDQLNTHFADSSFATRELGKFLARQPEVLKLPTTLVTLSQGHFKELAPFTRDRAKLQAALAKAPVKYSWDLERNGKSDYSPLNRLDTSQRALEEMAQAYARIPGRKNLIWMGGGFPTIDPESMATKDFEQVRDQLKHVNEVLLDTRVTLFVVDPTSSAAGMSELVNFEQIATAEMAGVADGLNLEGIDQGEDFDSMSRVSGGRVIRSMNDVSHQIEVAVGYSARFYTLSYSPTSSTDQAQRFRNIKVVCKRPGAVVSTRTGYYAGTPVRAFENDRISYDLSTALDGTMPLRGLRVSVRRDTSVAAGEDAWLVEVSAPGLTWTPQDDGRSVAHVQILAGFLAKNQKVSGHVLHGGSATANAGVNLGDESKMAIFHFDAKPDPKASMVRFVVRDATNGRMGSFDVPLR